VHNTLPTIAITPGEPSGIGPDLCLKICQQTFPAELVFITDPSLMQTRAKQLKLSCHIDQWHRPQAISQQPGHMNVHPVITNTLVQCGQLDPQNAPYVLNTLKLATQGCLTDRFQALVTGPIQKSVINQAGIAFSGHTEYLAKLTQTQQTVMMLATEGLRVALVTTHLPVAQISQQLTQAKLTQVLTVLDHDLRTKFGIAEPRILVCGLNPHAGENGYLGHEEIDIITPVLQRLKATMNLSGPLPADTAFTPKYLDNADVVLTMYHDQGLPVLKYKGFGNAINITLGLPIIRTSVDHGTALDLAGTGHINTQSLELAIHTAINLTLHRRETAVL